MTTLESLLNDKVLLLDGGMGTQIFARSPSVEDYGGAALEGCVDLLTERRPQWIREIHESYFRAGADAVETNTFGANPLVLGEFGLSDKAYALNVQAASLAKEVARSFDRPRFVIGSVGPGTKLITLGHVTYANLLASYRVQMEGLLEGGADAILIETCQDLGQIKVAVRAAREIMAAKHKRVPLWVQATVETTGTLLVGSDISAVLTSVEPLGIDVLGLNCATGPDEMHQHLQTLCEASPFRISCLPNAGLPENRGGQVVYPLDPAGFAPKVLHAASEFGLAIVGGCCGTTPDHIRALAPGVEKLNPPRREPKLERSAASLYQSVALRQEPAPLIVGERTNANGSKKFRDLLAAEDWEGMIALAKEQQREGAHLLDLCVAYVGRDEVRDADELLSRLVSQINLPLMIDSTEFPVIERALQRSPGKCVINSINFEDGEAKARAILGLCKTYGAAVVALTIDERGMAKGRGQKLDVAKRLYALAVGEYGLDPGDLIIDPLTFTLGSGDEEFRGSAIETLEALRLIKAELPGVMTILGVSNVSFGLNPATRHILNALMLYHGVKHGLDMAIFNASKVIPVAKIDPEDRKIVEDLIFDRRAEGYDPLKALMARFSDRKTKVAEDHRADLPVLERLHRGILDGEKQAILADVDEALKDHDPLKLINEVLLGAMKIVGERFGAGEMQLPFVLESAEAMKAAIKRIEPHLPRESTYQKGRILLATVKGDVHDIGKNLVDIILSNNGFEVKNLGIKQPIEAILKELDAWPAEAIGLSGLLVKSTVIMKENLHFMESLDLKVPVILGGAALTRDYVEGDCRRTYSGSVYYAEDAFEGLRHMQALVAGETSVPAPVSAAESGDGIKVIRRGTASVALTEYGQSSWIRHEAPSPEPPFWGVRELSDAPVDLFEHLDEFALIRNRWGFVQGSQSDETFAAVLRDKAEPQLAYWRDRLAKDRLFQPRARYGYFPARAEGDALRVFDPADPARSLALLEFPRQASGRRLCITDFFRADQTDVLALQLVTLGQAAADHAAKLYKEDGYADYFAFHGLATELTEAYAERLHARIRRELGIHAKDLPGRALFAQGYQGSRYSYGYPACPDLQGNGPILDLLNGQEIGVHLSESHQMDPEYTTSALVAWHPQARYFSI
ncbi:5-methyltetrahydrofolate--homocysteine methyltransferase [Geothrix limicola]|uniref:Methionine synthase n=1 Tax=Geothrix limicola TaxID=2927978 RepID=A0ABQ5QDL2_9BACT|nr:methionine synthase [Geothrix limicola]GLH72937.1 5-methyltetrahydrofolate--homocysteine methyltransferase [Geothrix limicola]